MGKRAFLIHGWQGNPNVYWFPWLKDELAKRGYEVFVPAMPNPHTPQASEWVSCISDAIGTPTSSDYLVGHSLGVIAILRYLEQLAPGQEIGGAVFVAGFSYDLGIEEHKSFFTAPVNWDKVNEHCRKFIALHSDDDPYISMAHGVVFREKADAELVVVHGMGHFAVMQLPEALDAVLKLSQQ